MVSAKKQPALPIDDEQSSPNAQGSSALLFGRPLAPNWGDVIGPDPHRPGKSRARLLDPGIPVWSIVGYLRALEPEFSATSIDGAAGAFDVPVSTVTAAVAYYLEHRDAIDAVLTLHADVVA